MNILYGEPFSMKNIASWSVHCYEVVSGLSQLGHNVVLLGGSSFVPSLMSNIDGQRHKPSLWMRLVNKLDSFRILQLFRGEISILLLVLQDLWTFLLTFITIVRWRGRLNVIYRRHNLLISQYLLAKLFRIRLVTELNGIVADEMKIRKHGDKCSLWVIDKIERFNIPKSDKIITPTSRSKIVLQEEYGVPENKIAVIPNGANTDMFQPMNATEARRELGLHQSNRYVCFVGAFNAWSGIDYLIRSVPLVLQECSDTRFILVGDGQMKQQLIELVEPVGVVDKVIFTGMVPYQDTPLYMNASDVCVYPEAKNFRNERIGGSPLKLHEYMACGKPVVVGNIAGVSDDIVDADSGIVVNPRNEDEMARAIITLLKNKQLGKKMGKRGREVTVGKYSWTKIAEQVAEVCQSAVKQKGGHDGF